MTFGFLEPRVCTSCLGLTEHPVEMARSLRPVRTPFCFELRLVGEVVQGEPSAEHVKAGLSVLSPCHVGQQNVQSTL